MSRSIGFVAEHQARRYLISQGLVLVRSNYRCRFGEIDLIMRDLDCFVFIEVRTRNSKAFGGAVASVDHHKQKKLIKTASYYLLEHKLQDQCPLRFDVLGFEGIPSQVIWIKNAFEVHGYH